MQLYTIQTPHTHAFSGMPIVYSFACAPYTIQERRRDIRISVRVQKEVAGTGQYTEVATQLIYPDLGGKVTIDIASIADAYLTYFTPAIGLDTQVQATGNMAKFRCSVIIQKDGVLIGSAIETSDVLVYKGGLAYEQYHYRNFFDQNLFTDKKPLHFYTGKETVRYADKKFMYWINNREAQENQVVFVEFYAANGNVFGYGIDTLLYSRRYNVFVMPIGLADLRAITGISDTNFNKIIYKYTVQVHTVNVSGVEMIVEPQTFWVDQRTYYNTTQLLYINSLGALDDIGILGETETQAEYETTGAEQVTVPGGIKNALLQPQNLSWSQETEKFIGSTTFISKDKVNRLRDLLLSPNVYEYKDGKLLPVVINKKTVKFYASRDTLYSLAIEWQHAFSNEFYTPAGTIAADNSCPALISFQVLQVARGTLQVMWHAPQPHDIIKVEVDNGVPEELVTVILSGNTGSQYIDFPNGAVYPDTLDIIVKGYVVCNADSDPMETGLPSIRPLTVVANSIPVPADDFYTLQAGFTTPQALTPSVLDNDYDPDGDAMEVTPASGATDKGGSYSIDIAGMVTYTPPSAIFNGVDFFTYAVRDVITPAVSATANAYINVGNISLGSATYIKIVERNHFENNSGGMIKTIKSGGDFYMTFWADPAATIPKDLTGILLLVNVSKKVYNYEAPGNWVLLSTTSISFYAKGTELLVFSGVNLHATYFNNQQIGGSRTDYAIAPGTGYIPI